MSNAAWFSQQLRHWRDNVAWTAERALAEISSRETELCSFWTDQAARDYKARYGALREEVQVEVIQSLRNIVAAMESLEIVIADTTGNIQLVDAQLSEASYTGNRVSTHIDAAYRHMVDCELRSGEVELKINQARAAMERAFQLLSFSEPSDKTDAADHGESNTGKSEIGESCSELSETVKISKSVALGTLPLWNTERINEPVSAVDFNLSPIGTSSLVTPILSFSPGSALGHPRNALDLRTDIGSIMPSWAHRQGDNLMLGFSTVCPAGALPFLGTSPAAANSYLSLRLGTDTKWHTPLGFGSSPASYDLKIGTSSLSVGASGFEYSPPINVALPALGLSTGGGSFIGPVQALSNAGMSLSNNTCGATFGNTCCLSS